MSARPAGDDPWRVNADLHCHSTASDGTLAPAELVRRAKAHGVDLFALTDHDELAGLAEAQATAREVGLAFLAGVEVSVSWADETIHIVGLGIDPQHPDLVAGLAALRGGRSGRAREMGEQLARAGIVGAYDGALALAGNPALVSRTHFARFLVERGVCTDVYDVFSRFLIEGKPGFVPHRWARLSAAVGWIRGAGGTAVLAHPGRYALDDVRRWALFSEFREAGGEAIEVVTGSHTRDEYGIYARHARDFGFQASRGSDFHDPVESRMDLGRLPPLPDSVEPVWRRWT